MKRAIIMALAVVALTACDNRPLDQHNYSKSSMSNIPELADCVYIKIEDVRMGVNYGLNKVRFTSPVPVGSKVRGHMKLLEAVAIDGNGMQLTWEMKIEREGSEKPSCIAESLARYYV